MLEIFQKYFGLKHVNIYICHVKHSKFINVSYKYLVELVKSSLPKSSTLEDINIDKISRQSMVDRKLKGYWDEIDLKVKQQSVLDFLHKNKDVFDELDKLIVDFEQHKVMLEPDIHVARTTDVRTKIKYLTAKTFFPYPEGKRKEVKIFLGRADKYNDDTKNPRAKRDAEVKMRQTLARRIREGSL